MLSKLRKPLLGAIARPATNCSRVPLALCACAPLAMSATAALAHAHLQQATPAAGSTTAPPGELRLKFSESIEPAFSTVAITSAGGATIPVDRPSLAAGDHSTLIVKIGQALKPGAYTVNWRAVSVDTHRTQGSFTFTVKP